jgi:hypothetical protein
VCELDAPGVEVVMLERSAGGLIVHLQSYATGAVEVRLGSRKLRVAPQDYVAVPLDLRDGV